MQAFLGGDLNLPTAIQSFVLYLRAERNYADKTIAGVMHDLELFARRFPGEPETWTKDHIRLFLGNARWAASTRLLRYKSLKAFFQFCHNDGLLPTNPMTGVSKPKGASKIRPPEKLDERDMEILISVWPQRHWMGLRNRAILCCYFTMPFRLAELAHLEVRDLDFVNSSVWARKSKGNEHGYSAVIFPKTARVLDQYRNKLPDEFKEHPYLWVAQDGKQLAPHGIQQVLSRTEMRAKGEGFTKHIWSHGFRHMWGIQTVQWGLATDVAAQTMGQKTTVAAELYRKIATNTEAQNQVRRIAGLTA